MKIYKTQKAVEKDIKNGVLTIKGNVRFECSISVDTPVIVTHGSIYGKDIRCWDINCCDINCRDINCWDINCRNINCCNITCRDINCWNINCEDISYYALFVSYNNITCKSWRAKRNKHIDPICIEGILKIVKEKDSDIKKAIKLLESKGRLKDGKLLF
jgi:hypothetical protein